MNDSEGAAKFREALKFNDTVLLAKERPYSRIIHRDFANFVFGMYYPKKMAKKNKLVVLAAGYATSETSSDAFYVIHYYRSSIITCVLIPCFWLAILTSQFRFRKLITVTAGADYHLITIKLQFGARYNSPICRQNIGNCAKITAESTGYYLLYSQKKIPTFIKSVSHIASVRFIMLHNKEFMLSFMFYNNNVINQFHLLFITPRAFSGSC